VRVIARLQSGVLMHHDWPLPLDAVLAAAMRRQRLDVRYGAAVDHHAENIPIVVCKKSGWKHLRIDTGAQWWHLASCAAPVGAAAEDVRWWHKRFNGMEAIDLGVRVPTSALDGKIGRYRAWRTPEVVTVCAALEWVAIGDPAAISDVLSGVRQLGRNRSMGEGLVLDWDVIDIGDPDPLQVIWRDGMIGRPIPARCAPSLGVPDCDITRAPIRPPYFRAPQRDPGSGGFARILPEVIAPWTRLEVAR
jgi:hypothetical protein